MRRRTGRNPLRWSAAAGPACWSSRSPISPDNAARAARPGLRGRLHRHLVARGYRRIRRTGINSWYAPADAPFRLDLKGRAQFVRKYHLGLPFRVLRDKKRQWLKR
jgi:hypothetical protein